MTHTLSRRALGGFALLVGGTLLGAWKVVPRVYNARKLERLAGRRIYDEKIDAYAALAASLVRANSERKRLLVILGGNWCQWCLALDDLIHSDPEIQRLLQKQFVLLNLDGDAAADLDEAWGRPTRLGVPVLVFLDQAGKVQRVQDSVSLEAFGGRLLLHDRTRVLDALIKTDTPSSSGRSMSRSPPSDEPT